MTKDHDPCEGEVCTVCGAAANHRVIGHPTVRGTVCQKHVPNDDRGDVFALND